jgi:hypothetical protein
MDGVDPETNKETLPSIFRPPATRGVRVTFTRNAVHSIAVES